MSRRIIHTPHDKLFKSSLQYPQVAQEFLELYLPTSIKEQLDFNSIKYCQSTFVDEQLKLSQTDVLFKCTLAEQEGYIYVLAEHESKVDNLIAFWLMKYMIAIWDHHIKETSPSSKTLPLPVIFPLVFYTGGKQYNAPRELWQLFGKHSEKMKTLLRSPFHLVETQKISETALKSHLYAGTMSYIINEHFRRRMTEKIDRVVDNLNSLVEKEHHRYVVDLITYLLGVDNQHNKIEELIALMQNKISPNLENTMSSLADKLIAEGERRGEIKGEIRGEIKGETRGEMKGALRGKIEGKLEIAQQMLNEGFELPVIAKVTQLPLEKIIALN